VPAPRFRIVTPAECRRMPWRNGLGTTLEIVTDAAAPDAPWSWRFSIADVPARAAFSAFAGFDRWLLCREGAGLRVAFGDQPAQPVPHAKVPGTALAFRGEDPATGEPLGPGVRDLNLFAARDRWTAELTVAAPGTALPPADVLLVHALAAARVRLGGAEHALGPGDTLVALGAGALELPREGPALPVARLHRRG
jgi:environmental stress-induced protein Ves